MAEPLSEDMRTSARVRTARPADDVHADGRLLDAEAGDDSGMERDRESAPGAPRWVKAFGIIAIVLVLLFVGLHLTGNAPTHMPGSGGAEHGLRQAP